MLPIYALILGDDPVNGVNVISVVADPAIEENCLKFSSDKFEIKLSQDNEKHELFGPVLIPDLLIYRRAANGLEYYVTFSRETIDALEKRYFKSGFNFNVSLDHSGENVQGFVFESFIKDESLGVNPAGWDVPSGTWFIRMKIEDDAAWEKIKNEGLSGFSVECFMEGVEIGEALSRQKEETEQQPQAKPETMVDRLLDGKI